MKFLCSPLYFLSLQFNFEIVLQVTMVNFVPQLLVSHILTQQSPWVQYPFLSNLNLGLLISAWFQAQLLIVHQTLFLIGYRSLTNYINALWRFATVLQSNLNLMDIQISITIDDTKDFLVTHQHRPSGLRQWTWLHTLFVKLNVQSYAMHRFVLTSKNKAWFTVRTRQKWRRVW
jgi:hypothetical protein